MASLRYLRPVPFDIGTEQGRRDERYRLAALSAACNVVSRLVGVLVMLLSVSLTVPYLGVERFGVWMTIASFAGLLTFLDLGVGNALTNHVAQKVAAGTPDALRSSISGGLGFLAVIGFVMSAGLCLLAANLPWQLLIKVEQAALVAETRAAAMCFGLLFGLNIFTSGIQRIFAGMQQAYLGHMAMALGSTASCVGLWVAASSQQGIPVLLAVMLGSQSAAGLLLLLILKKRKQFTLRGIADSARREAPHLLRIGGLFFVLQIGTMVGWGADSLIISSMLGASQVAVFSVVQRLFQFASQPLGIINAPLWGAYADANARGDKAFIRTTLQKSLLVTLLGASAASVLLVLVHPWFIDKWTHGSIMVPWHFVVVYGAWVVLDAVGNAFAMFLNGTGIVRQQVIVVVVFVLTVVPFKLYLVREMGLMAIPLATITAYALSTVGLYGLAFWPVIRKKIV